ncbi:MAG: class I SAM-dependent methyltransferase [Planctomycetes bacterium]|nr:class I SAM-dependent methyltransferase [Planctomycetota bacterium]
MTIHWGRFYDVVVWLFFTGKEQIVRKQTVELAHIKPGDKVLDVGCGTGTLTLAAREKTGSAGEVHGIDSSPEMIDVASKKATGIGADIKFQVALIEAIPYPNGYFDVVLSSLMIHHLPGDALKQKAFSEMRRVLKPGGRILIVDFEPPTGPLSRRIATLIVGPDMMKSNLKAMHPMMKKAGFTEITSGGTKSKIISFTRGIVYDKSAWEGKIV